VRLTKKRIGKMGVSENAPFPKLAKNHFRRLSSNTLPDHKIEEFWVLSKTQPILKVEK
jgi:hypothetical protein